MWKKWESLDQLEPLQSLAKNLDELCTTRLLAPKARAHALMVVGNIREDRVPMREWEATAREALELMKASDDQVGLVNAQSLWAKVLRAQGRFGESLEVCESALEGLRRLGPSVIGEAAYSDVEVDLLTGKGKTLRERGQSREALADFEAAAAIRQRVSDEDSENELKRRRLAVAHVNLADTLRDTPRSDEAAAYFFRAMEVIQSPRGADFGAETAEQEVASLQARYGDLLLTGGDEVGALKQFEKAEATLRRLTTADPDQLSWKDDLAQMYVRIGNIYCSRGELENGDTRFTWARDILAALAERDPTNPSWKHSVGNICAAIGVLRQEQSRWSEAVKEYIEAERVLGELALSDPDAVSWQLAHATARQALGQLFEKVAPAFENETEKINFLTRAVIQFNGAQTTLSRLVERDAGNSTWQSSLAWVYRQKAGVLETLAEWIESGVKVEDVDMSPQRLYESSRTAYLSSLNIMSQLVTQTPGNTSFRRELAL
jgi:tetratricopeptide (TPR) repeat protein